MIKDKSECLGCGGFLSWDWVLVCKDCFGNNSESQHGKLFGKEGQNFGSGGNAPGIKKENNQGKRAIPSTKRYL